MSKKNFVLVLKAKKQSAWLHRKAIFSHIVRQPIVIRKDIKQCREQVKTFIKGKMVDGKQGILIPMTETERQNINTYTAPTYTEVKAKLLKAQNYADLSSDLEKTKDKEKYEYWLDAWLHAKRLGVKESTYIRYRNTIENHIKPDLGKYPINKISTSLMEQFLLILLAS